MLWSILRAFLWTNPMIGAVTIFMGSVSLLASIVDGTGRLQHRIARRWGRLILTAGFVRATVTGLENLVPGATYVFCSNHLSLTDTPLVFGYLPWEFRVLAKKVYFQIPFLGWHLRRAGHLPVVTKDVRAAVRTMAEAARRVQQGTSLVIFPEGSRSRDGKLGEFRSGAAHIGVRAGVPLVPMCIQGTRETLDPGSLITRPGNVELRIGAPIPTTGLKNRDAGPLMAEVRNRILGLRESISRGGGLERAPI